MYVCVQMPRRGRWTHAEVTITTCPVPYSTQDRSSLSVTLKTAAFDSGTSPNGMYTVHVYTLIEEEWSNPETTCTCTNVHVYICVFSVELESIRNVFQDMGEILMFPNGVYMYTCYGKL